MHIQTKAQVNNYQPQVCLKECKEPNQLPILYLLQKEIKTI